MPAPPLAAIELDELAARYPTVPRSRVELVVDAYGPEMSAIEAELLVIVARQQPDSRESLDYTLPPFGRRL
jgi:hypothetical protein